mgnify:CR=1 FL=1
MGNPLVSVILPTYNRVEYLPRSIESVLAQTYPHWELIIWDDGSIDQTAELVRSFSDGRIRYFYGPNHGVASARNQAIGCSVGEYIAFLDSDDEWLPEKLARQVAVLDRYPEIDALFADFVNINLANRQEGIGFQQNAVSMKLLHRKLLEDQVYLIEGHFLEALLQANFIATDSMVLRKSILPAAGVFDAGLRHSEDFELWVRLGLSGAHFAFTDQVLLRRVKPAGSLSSPSVAAYENRLTALDACTQDIKVAQRTDLLPLIRTLYRMAWQGLIRQHAFSGDRRRAAHAFLRAVGYGINWRSIYLFLGALAGPLLSNHFRKQF